MSHLLSGSINGTPNAVRAAEGGGKGRCGGHSIAGEWTLSFWTSSGWGWSFKMVGGKERPSPHRFILRAMLLVG